MNEVRIAGGGLAGLSLAAGLLGRGVPVRVDEAGSYPRHRVCGEFISGTSPATLAALGIAPAFADARRHASVAWFTNSRRVLAARLPEPALGLSRFMLDRRLRDLVAGAGGVVVERSRVRPEPAVGRVWAAGRMPAAGEWVGLKCHLGGLDLAADLEMHLGTNGYVGLAGIEEDQVNVCGLFRVERGVRGQGAPILLEYLLRGGLDGLAARIEAGGIEAASCCAVAGFRLGWQRPRPGLCVLGDAGSMIPPFTGNGMSMAFQAAAIAVDPLAAWSRGALGWEQCRLVIARELRRRFRRRLRVAAWLHPLLTGGAGSTVVAGLGRVGLLPFRTLLGVLR
jgi:hypothetical protein